MKKFVKTLLVILFWLALWQGVSMAANQKLVLVSPLDTVKRLVELAGTLPFWSAVGTSFLHIISGFAAAVAAGVLLAVASSAFPPVYSFLSPVFSVMKATPVASLTLIFFLWVKARYLSAFVAFIMVLPIIYFGTYEGIKNTDAKLLQMAKVFGVGKGKVVREIYVPAAAPFLASAASVAVGFAWKSGIAAEVICIAGGTIGGKLYDAKLLLESADIFAWTAVIIIISKLIELAAVKLLANVGRKAK